MLDQLIDIRDSLIEEVFSGEHAYLSYRSGAMLDNLIDTLREGTLEQAHIDSDEHARSCDDENCDDCI